MFKIILEFTEILLFLVPPTKLNWTSHKCFAPYIKTFSTPSHACVYVWIHNSLIRISKYLNHLFYGRFVENLRAQRGAFICMLFFHTCTLWRYDLTKIKNIPFLLNELNIYLSQLWKYCKYSPELYEISKELLIC